MILVDLFNNIEEFEFKGITKIFPKKIKNIIFKMKSFKIDYLNEDIICVKLPLIEGDKLDEIKDKRYLKNATDKLYKLIDSDNLSRKKGIVLNKYFRGSQILNERYKICDGKYIFKSYILMILDEIDNNILGTKEKKDIRVGIISNDISKDNSYIINEIVSRYKHISILTINNEYEKVIQQINFNYGSYINIIHGNNLKKSDIVINIDQSNAESVSNYKLNKNAYVIDCSEIMTHNIKKVYNKYNYMPKNIYNIFEKDFIECIKRNDLIKKYNMFDIIQAYYIDKNNNYDIESLVKKQRDI